LSAMAIFPQSLRGSALFGEVVGVLSAVSVDINHCKAVVAENTPVAMGTIGDLFASYRDGRNSLWALVQKSSWLHPGIRQYS
jgi:hypothetical protein